ncbi:MAG: hypothetical protein RLZZ524_2452, partial [Pseudomonadota bacterium]
MTAVAEADPGVLAHQRLDPGRFAQRQGLHHELVLQLGLLQLAELA